MKLLYSEPQLNIIEYDFRDIVSSSPAASDDSLAGYSGDNDVSVPLTWWD